LLDSLSKSGCISFEHASLHVIIASTHCFGETLMNTVLKDNINPIEKLEHSILLISSTVHKKDISEIIMESEMNKLTYSSIEI